jgi:hypothetical protein
MSPTVSIFIKTWKRDLCWLKYCLRFLEKNWREENTEIVVMADRDCAQELQSWEHWRTENVHLAYCDPWKDGYSHAMYAKACADRSCFGDQILLLDSDAMLLEPCDLSKFKSGERPIIGWMSYFEHLKIHPMSPWQRVTEKVTKMRPWHHYMVWMPGLYYTDSLEKVRTFISWQHDRKPFEEIVHSDVKFDYLNFNKHPISFVDYDVIGFICSLIEPERYAFRHLSEIGPAPFCQYHSWTMWSDATEKELESKLASS